MSRITALQITSRQQRFPMALQTDTPALPPLIRVVDDNDTLRQLLEFMLQCEGYEVVSYASAMDFLKSDTPSRPGCLILDIQMPEMSGLDLFDRLNHRGYEVPVIFLTAHGDTDMAVGAMRDGACDFQTKIDQRGEVPPGGRAGARK